MNVYLCTASERDIPEDYVDFGGDECGPIMVGIPCYVNPIALVYAPTRGRAKVLACNEYKGEVEFTEWYTKIVAKDISADEGKVPDGDPLWEIAFPFEEPTFNDMVETFIYNYWNIKFIMNKDNYGEIICTVQALNLDRVQHAGQGKSAFEALKDVHNKVFEHREEIDEGIDSE
jgi:hypothetical protein